MTEMQRRQTKRFGWRRSLPDYRDRRFAIPRRFEAAAELPRSVALEKRCPPPMQQMLLSSCVPHAVTAAMRADRISQGLPDKALSRLQLYFDGRMAEGSVQDDCGMEIRTAIKCAAKIGVAEETLWPYMPSKFKTRPPDSAYRRAKKNEALTYEAVALDKHAIKAALASGHPVVFGISVYENFDTDETAKTGVIQMPEGHMLGGHAMYLTGYDDDADPAHARLRNSWGPHWGLAGDALIPWGYVTDPNLAADLWIVKEVGPEAEARRVAVAASGTAPA